MNACIRHVGIRGSSIPDKDTNEATASELMCLKGLHYDSRPPDRSISIACELFEKAQLLGLLLSFFVNHLRKQCGHPWVRHIGRGPVVHVKEGLLDSNGGFKMRSEPSLA